MPFITPIAWCAGRAVYPAFRPVPVLRRRRRSRLVTLDPAATWRTPGAALH